MSETIVEIKEVKEKDDYGNLFFTDIGNNEYKIAAKRDRLFQYIVSGNQVKLTWKSYQNHQYIDDVGPMEEELAGEYKEVAKQPPKLEEKISGQEHGLWIKEIGEWLRLFHSEGADKNNPIYVALRTFYFAEMKRVLGITIKKEEG